MEEIKQLYKRMQKQISAKVPPPEVDDMVQETVAEAWEHRQQLRDGNYYPGWIAAIAGNHIAEYYRQQARRVKVFEMPKEKSRRLKKAHATDRLFTQNSSSSTYWNIINADEFAGMAASIEQSDFEMVWGDLVLDLPPHYIEILTLYILDGYTMPEIAVMLGKTYRGTWSLYRRAKALLCEAYMKD